MHIYTCTCTLCDPGSASLIKAQLSHLCDRADENGDTKEELDICFALFVKYQERLVFWGTQCGKCWPQPSPSWSTIVMFTNKYLSWKQAIKYVFNKNVIKMLKNNFKIINKGKGFTVVFFNPANFCFYYNIKFNQSLWYFGNYWCSNIKT